MALRFPAALAASLALTNVTDKALAQAAAQVMLGQRPTPGQFNVFRTVLQDAKPVVASAAAPTYNFFDGPALQFVRNTETAGSVNTNQVFIARKIRLKLTPFMAPDGTEIIAAASEINGGTGLATLVQFKRLLETGIVNCKFGQRDIVRNVFGVWNFGAGGGAALSGFGAAAATTAPGVLNNGNPDVMNGWVLSAPQQVVNGEPISFTVQYATANPAFSGAATWTPVNGQPAVANTAGTLAVLIEGDMIQRLG